VGRREKGEGVYNVVVIGAGTAGLVTAAGTAGLGGRVALVERHKMGGDCLNYGCVPSKALIRSSRVAALMRRADLVALDPARPAIDYRRVARRVKAVRAKIAPHDSVERFEGLGVDVFLGDATLESPHAVRVGGTLLRARNIVLATGGRSAVPDVPGLQEASYFTNETIFEREEAPGRLLVIGGGPIGCELAQAMTRLGAQPTVVDRGRRLLHREDPDVADLLKARMEDEGVRLLLRGRVESVVPGRGGPHRVKVRQERDGGAPAQSVEVEADTILVASGRRPNVEGLGLERAGVAFTPRGVSVNAFLQTSRPNIYAAGDICGPYQFTHFADYQARIVVRNILVSPLLGLGRARADYRVVPWTTFTEPEVARVGLNEEEAARARIPFDTHRVPYADLDRAILESEDTGFVKVIAAKGRGTILGATIAGAGAGELIHEFALAMKEGIGLAALSSMMHVYPTLSQAAQRAGDAFMRTRLTPGTRAIFSRLYAWQRRDP
jgi:pyruvate/2-oxoglutarate dehydrogenase complex dihydrolipoamide dehydrogenase (E3) component